MELPQTENVEMSAMSSSRMHVVNQFNFAGAANSWLTELRQIAAKPEAQIHFAGPLIQFGGS